MLSVSLLETLPDEILGYIMTATLHSYPDLPSQHRFPTTMLLTSRRFQRVALSTPYLWTTLLIGLPLNLDAVTTRLKRAGVLPLQVEVGWTEEVQEVQNADRLAETLHQEAHRLVEFRLQCCFSATAQAQDFVDSLFPPDVTFPFIDRLTLEVRGQFGDVTLSRPNTFPKLYYLRGRQIDPRWTTWRDETLRELYLYNCDARTLQDMVHFLGAFPSLRLVHFQQFQLAESEFDIGETVVLMPELEVLRLIETTLLDCNIMLGVLDMPKLRSLVLGGGADGSTGQVWVPLHKPFPTLREVSILQWFNYCMDDDRPFFRNLAFLGPNVTRFRFDWFYFTVTKGLGLGCTFPKIRHLATRIHMRGNKPWPDLASLDQLSIHVQSIGMYADFGEQYLAQHEIYMAELREKANVNVYGKIGCFKGCLFKNRELMCQGVHLNDDDADAPKDEFLDLLCD